MILLLGRFPGFFVKGKGLRHVIEPGKYLYDADRWFGSKDSPWPEDAVHQIGVKELIEWND
jgi:hypothetical protein